MDCRSFRDGFEIFTDPDQPDEVFDSDQYDDWCDHQDSCPTCLAWYQDKMVRLRGHDPKDFPCLHVAFYSTGGCDEHDDPLDCPDRVIHYDETFGAYGVPIKDGEATMILISYCPWCGIRLPDAQDQQSHWNN